MVWIGIFKKIFLIKNIAMLQVIFLVLNTADALGINIETTIQIPQSEESIVVVETESISPEESEPEIPTVRKLILTRKDRSDLTRYLNEQAGSWSMYLLDVESRSEYVYHPDSYYYCASLMKVTYAYWLSTLADAGDIDFFSMIPNIKRGRLADGDLSEHNNDHEIPIQAALYSMLAHSNNDAVSLLANCWPGNEAAGFIDFLRTIGYTYPETVDVSPIDGIHGMITVEDIGKTLKHLYQYFDSDSPNAQIILKCMKNADHDILYIPKGVIAAKKYGSWDGAYHDVAIVYDKHPYIICVLSDRGNTNEDYPEEPTAIMQTIGRMIMKITNSDQISK